MTLIDVENGMYDLSLHTILTPPCFVFFWGLVQKANRLKPRFKNPFSLTVAQAFAAGGGNSRQAVNQKQKQLNKIEIDGETLITITSGSKIQNLAAKYEINYRLIVPESVGMTGDNGQPSKILDELMSEWRRSGDGTVDGLMSFLRSDQKREEKTTTEEVAAVPPSAEEEEEPIPTIRNDEVTIEGLILSKYRGQIMDRPPSPSNLRAALEIYTVDQLEEAVGRMPPILQAKNPKTVIDGNYALSTACGAVEHPEWWTHGNGVDYVELNDKAQVESELKRAREYLEELKENQAADKKHPEDYDHYISGLEGDIKELEAKL